MEICSYAITFKLLTGDLKIAGPSVNDPTRLTVSPPAARAVGFQLFPTSCIVFEASVIMTYSRETAHLQCYHVRLMIQNHLTNYV